jgi:deazaflavin-dependent oxidoreductase (nitroreductase family)
MNDQIRKSLTRGHLIDITTTGRKTGAPRRVEIVFHNIDGRLIISGSPRADRKRAWLFNLESDPHLTFHLKGSTRADLPATARVITDAVERAAIADWIVKNAWPNQDVDKMTVFSPMIEVTIDDLDRSKADQPHGAAPDRLEHGGVAMSYPEPRYHGDTGEASARLRPADQAPDVRYASGGTAHYLATTATTGGEFGLYRWEMSAQPSGPGPHFHRTISECFYVLSGTVRLYDGTRWIDGVPGDFLFVPEGGIHGFRNESGAPASMLLLFAPGAPREDYFETLARAGEVEAMTEDERQAFYLRHDNHWV